ncbi:MAG: hypothetical protein C4523_14990 [Myxococcales bacterium]|nr:MAG: hypothetical protein C4523_14990 [Myxococcales bacterium]
MRKSAILLLFVLAGACTASTAYGFYETESAGGSFSGRGALDLSAGFWVNPGPREVPDYERRTDGQGGLTLRLLLDARAGERARFEFNGFHVLQTEAKSFGAANAFQPYRTTYLDYEYLTGEDDFLRASAGLDQLSLKLFTDYVDFTVGRQPIGFGAMFLFSPADFFYPFASTAADRQFRPGVDAARVDIRIGSLSQIALLGALGYADDDVPDFNRSALLARSSVNVGGWDILVLGGQVHERYTASLGLLGEIDGVGLRSEGAIFFPRDDTRDWSIQAALGADYRWENSLHLIGEYFYNGRGATNSQNYPQAISDRYFAFSPFLGQHYAGISLSGEATPLLQLQGTVLINLQDPSAYLSPALIYSLSNEAELIAYLGIPVGRQMVVVRDGLVLQTDVRSEYGLYPYILMVQARVFF